MSDPLKLTASPSFRSAAQSGRAVVGAFVIGVGLASFAHASIVSAVGDQAAIGDRIRTTTLAKVHDPDGDGAYGSAGWEFFGVGGGNNEGPGFESQSLIGLPAFISDIAAVPGGAGFFAAYNGYAPIDDPRQPIGSSVSDVISGFAYAAPVAQGVESPMFRIVVGADAPDFRVGFLVNQEFSFVQWPSNLRLASTSSQASLAVSMTSGFGQCDMYFFDVVGAAPGETIDVFATAGGSRNVVAISGVTFDVIPAPSSAGLLALAGLASLRRRR